MTVSERLYTLRREKGLSQEQLAEALGVSRQAVSKWESGAAMPESERLIALAAFYGVSLDALLGLEREDTPRKTNPSSTPHRRLPIRLGWALSAMGAVGAILFAILLVAKPSVSEQIAASSTVTLDGRAILLIVCLLLAGLGVGILVKNTMERRSR